jgi:hypothetical protein
LTELKSIIKGIILYTDAGAMNEYLGVLFKRPDEGEFLLSQRQNFLDVPQPVCNPVRGQENG